MSDLGWMTGNTFSARPGKDIRVDGGSLVELKSALHAVQADVKAGVIDVEARKRFRAKVTAGPQDATEARRNTRFTRHQNAGVSLRSDRDRDSEGTTMSASQRSVMALKVKVRLWGR